VHRALNGGKTVTKEHYRDYLMQIATKNINEDHGVVLAPARTELLPTARYKGPNGENSENTHAFPVFASDAEREMDQAATAPRGSGAPGKPIIEEVGTPIDRNRNASASSSEGISYTRTGRRKVYASRASSTTRWVTSPRAFGRSAT
jgi:hypothetical protein